MTYPLVIADIKSSCVCRVAGSLFSRIGMAAVAKIPIEASSRRPTPSRLGTIDDSATTGPSRLLHDGHHLTPAWWGPEKPGSRGAGRITLSSAGKRSGKAED